MLIGPALFTELVTVTFEPLPLVVSVRLAPVVTRPVTLTAPAFASVPLPPENRPATFRAPLLLSVRSLPKPVVPLKLATWFWPIRLVTPELLVVSAFARIRPLAAWLIVGAFRLTLPVVRIEVAFTTPFIWIELVALTLIVPPPGTDSVL